VYHSLLITEIETGSKWKKNPYIPLTKTPDITVDLNSLHILPNKAPVREFRPPTIDELDKTALNEIEVDNLSSRHYVRRKRSDEKSAEESKINEPSAVINNFNVSDDDDENTWKAMPASQPSVVIYTKDEKIVLPPPPPPPPVPSQLPSQKDTLKITNNQQAAANPNLPHFHVSYWMFYPFSQGKTICTLNLGPLGPIPIPLIWNICLGQKKEFGSHVGDWEHFSIVFRGKMEPDVSHEQPQSLYCC
jgi:hypothetical protein